MREIPSRIFEIVQQLKESKPPRRATVRKVLKWFNASRRGANVVNEIQETLAVSGLETEPVFAAASLDEPLRFILCSSPTVAQDLSPSLPSITTSPSGPQGPALSEASPENPSPDLLEPESEEISTSPNLDDRPVSSQPHDWTLSTLRDKWDRGQLDLQPTYQREYVWRLRPELPSRLIESLLLEIPIPPIYFGKTAGARLEVIDGQQRLTTMIEFMSNKFPLQRLERMGSLNGKLFRELSEDNQSKILDAPIRSVVIDAGNNTELRYEIFERLNRGSMALNEQELRNCVFRGVFNDLLAELEQDSYWRKVRGSTVPEPRFIEREAILRFFAFVNRIQFYAGNLKRFLNEYMKSYAPRDIDQIKVQANMFRQTIQNIYTVFGSNSARLYNLDDRTNKGAWDTKFSVAALDIQASALVGKPIGKVQAAAEQIREQYLFSLLTDPMLQAAISKQTGGTIQTKYRWTALRSLVEPIIDGYILEPRFFDYAFRRQLFDKSPICKICGNQIHLFEDSTVDHIHPYGRGGKTIPENSQLAHRSCNARKNMSLPSVASNTAISTSSIS
ncbi:MAG: hypothetical protein JWM83_3039 [Candidatus Angelobacter sp.]|nr:hypothetical protein [Candidatus Angelobacter sp.]